MPENRLILMIAATLLAPVLLMLLARERALRGAGDRNGRWFTFARRAQTLTLGSALAWVVMARTAVSQVPAIDHVSRSASPAGILLVFLAVFTPVAILPAVLSLIAHDVARRLETTLVTWRELLGRLGWGVAGVMTPILGLGLGSYWLVRGQVLPFLLIAIAGIAGGIACLTRHQRSLGFTPHAITHGELRDRLFELAARAGVKLDQLYVLPMKRVGLANAFAVSGRRVVVTDLLLERLTRDEVDAVMTHEVAHLRRRDLPRLLLARLVLAGVPFGLAFPHGWGWAVSAFWLGLTASHTISRRIERDTDREALRLGARPRALISGLVQLSQLGHIPIRWNRLTGWMLTHPSVAERARDIGREGGVSEPEIEALLAGARGEAEHYAAEPWRDAGEKLFNSTFKNSVLTRNSFVLLGLALFTPAAVFAAARGLGSGPAPRLATLAVALILTPAVCLIVLDFFAVQPLHALRRKLAARLGLGDDPRAAGWWFAGLSTHAAPRVYEGFANWDVGFVRVADGALEFAGDSARFALPLERVVRAELTPGAPSWIPTRAARCIWRDDEGAEHAVRWTPMEGSGLHSVGAGAEGLLREIESAIASRAVAARAPAAPLPPRGEVTCTHPAALVKPATFVRLLVMDLFLSVMVAAIYKVPVFSFTQATWFELVFVAFSSQIVLLLPIMRYRDAFAPAADAARQRRAA